MKVDSKAVFRRLGEAEALCHGIPVESGVVVEEDLEPANLESGSAKMPKIAYFQPFSGASGDMFLGALVHAGLLGFGDEGANVWIVLHPTVQELSCY